jgi:hypothetical protein
MACIARDGIFIAALSDTNRDEQAVICLLSMGPSVEMKTPH